MRRAFVVVLLLTTFISQLLAISGRGDALGHVQDDAHAVLHWKGHAHHHHDDGSLSHDDSEESTQHLLIDSVLTAPGLPPFVAASLPPLPGAQPPSVDALHIPYPDLCGIKRPPRLAA